MRSAGTLLLLFSLFAGCSSASEAPAVPVRECGLKIWHKPASADAHVQIIGDWDGWKRPGVTPEKRPDGWRVASVAASPGEHAYAIIEDGVWLTDKNEPMTGTFESHEVTVATAEQCERPAVKVDAVETRRDGATIKATFLASTTAKALEPKSIVVKGRDGTPLVPASVDPANGTMTFEVNGLARGKYTFAIAAKDIAGVDAEDARATVWIDGGNEPWHPRDAIVYQIMLDRFRGKDGALAPPATPSARAGGSLAGVKRALEAGEFEALGVTALWLSPLYKNPRGEFAGNDGRKYTSYHGYWPIDSRALDERFATEAELDAFMAAAHSRGIRVLFDVVPNHVHAEHRYAKEKSGWFKEDCVCGQGSCDWGAHIKTCWFAPYLPDFDWTNKDVGNAATEDVMWWFDRFDADGIRIDAVPMMPRAATRRIATAVRRRYEHEGNHLYVLGENFTGPTGYQSLRYDLGPYGLDGSFHFPLMWTIREALATERSPFSAVEESYRAGEAAWDGADAVMGLMIGNHDVSRFASVSAGNSDGDAWESPAQPNDPFVYRKQRVALATVLTLPGAPVIYYGDEVGLAGRSDPDCRRVMPSEESLIDEQKATRDLARRVGKARRCSHALRRGDIQTLVADAERFVFAREADGDVAIVALTRRPTHAMNVTLPSAVSGPLVDVVTGKAAEMSNGKLTVSSEPFQVSVYFPAGSACAGSKE